MGASQLDRNAKMISAMNRLKSKADSGSPCRRPMLEVRGRPS